MGRSLNDARTRAGQIQYNISSKDSILDIGNGFAISKDSKYRGQMIELRIQVPVGKKLRFDETVTRKLNPVEIRMNDRRSRLRRSRIDIDYNDWFEYRTNVDYVMTENGTLVDPNKPQKDKGVTPVETTGDYRYEDATPATTNSIEEQRKKVQEEQQKLKDMEEKKKDSISGNGKRESLDDNDDGDVAGSPVFSLIQIFN